MYENMAHNRPNFMGRGGSVLNELSGSADQSAYNGKMMIERINLQGTNNNNNMINWGAHHAHVFQLDHSSNFSELSTTSTKVALHELPPKVDNKFLSFGGGGHESLLGTQIRSLSQNIDDDNKLPAANNLVDHQLKSLKRKASSDNEELDLDLSLKLNSRVSGGDHQNRHEVDDDDDDDESNNNNILSLSLYSHHLSSSSRSRLLKEGEQDRSNSKEQGGGRKRGNNALDLTI